jgi:hypothetical protein
MKRISDKINQFDLTGMFLPFNPFTNNPVFLELDGKFLMPLFSTEEKYNAAKEWAGFDFAKIKRITNPEEFMESIALSKKEIEFHVVVDPYITPEGNTRFQLIPFNEEELKGDEK